VTRASPLQPAGPTPQPNEAKRLVILGATGSIGRSCAQVIGESAGRFAVAAVAAGRDGAALARVARALGARFAALADPDGYAELKAGLAGSAIEAAAGPEAVVEAALKPAPVTVAKSPAAHTVSLFECDGRSVGLLDEEKLFATLGRNLSW